MKTFLISLSDNTVIAVANEATKDGLVEKFGEAFKVSSIDDLTRLAENKLFDLCNSFTGQEENLSKDELASKIFEYLNGLDISEAVQLSENQKKEISEAPVKKQRKVGGSKLQRMKAAFMEQNEDGSYKMWTVPELIKKLVGDIEKAEDYKKEYNVVKVYISVLKSEKDRFVMNIVHDKKAGTYIYAP